MSFVYNRLYKLWLCQFDMVSDINNEIKYLITLLHARHLKPPATELLNAISCYTTNQNIVMSIKDIAPYWAVSNYYVGKESIRIDSYITKIKYYYIKCKVKIDFEKSEINPKYIKKYENDYIEY